MNTLIIFGAGKLPEIGSGIGSAIRNFKTGVAEGEIKEKEIPEKIEAGYAPFFIFFFSQGSPPAP